VGRSGAAGWGRSGAAGREGVEEGSWFVEGDKYGAGRREGDEEVGRVERAAGKVGYPGDVAGRRDAEGVELPGVGGTASTASNLLRLPLPLPLELGYPLGRKEGGEAEGVVVVVVEGRAVGTGLGLGR
jgi:hypothetical protein